MGAVVAGEVESKPPGKGGLADVPHRERWGNSYKPTGLSVSSIPQLGTKVVPLDNRLGPKDLRCGDW